MATRKEEKERRRQERLEAERRDKQAARRRLMLGYVVAGALTLAVLVGIVVVIAGGGGSSSGSGDTEAGLQETPPPWQPEYANLEERLNALKLPGLSETIYHVHALAEVYVNGKQVTVPANIGLDQATQTFSPLHTHDTSGVIHMEADRPYPFTLGEFFDVWGVKFTDTQLGSFTTQDGEKLQVYANGKPVKDPVNLKLSDHDEIVVGYGKPGSFPTKPKAGFPSGL